MYVTLLRKGNIKFILKNIKKWKRRHVVWWKFESKKKKKIRKII